MIDTFLSFNGTELRIVPHEPDNGYRFYVSRDGTIGLRVAPNGTQRVVNAKTDSTPNCKVRYNANRKQRYLKFCDAFGYHKPIFVAHAVYRAWSGQPIPANHQIHHLTGVTTDNCIDNLLCVSIREHRPIADVRQKALKAVVPNGNLYLLPYNRLRELQDPHIFCDDTFARELAAVKAEYAKMDHVPGDQQIAREMERHCEC